MEYNLDINQIRAVHSELKNVMICAPPGSGKTTVIINRVNYLINTKKVDPEDILVITFTRSSAFDMRNRYLSISNTENIPFFGTFHSLYYNILKKYRGKIEMISLSKACQLVKNVLVSYLNSIGDEKVKEILNDISLLKNTGYNIKDFKSKSDKTVFVECFNKYEEYKAVNGLMDFDDLQLKVKKIFRKDKNILDYYRKKFKYILVDEFQDCDKVQIEILQLIGRYNYLFAVGDEDQCIYSFRGSRPDSMVDFKKYFQDGEKLFLKINYRSAKNIVEMSKSVIYNNKNRNLKSICSSRQENGEIGFKIFPREKEQAYYVAKSIEKLVDKGRYGHKDIAVLYRTNIESRILIDAFLKYNIKFKLLDVQYNFFDHFICRDLIAYFKFSVDMCDKESFMSIINKPFRYIGRVNIEKVRRNKVSENCFEILRKIDDIPIFQLKVLDDLQKKMKKLNKIKLKDAVEFILNKVNYLDYLKVYCSKSNRDLEEFQHILREFKASCEDFDTIDEFLDHVTKVKNTIEQSAKEKDRVILSTIHGVKGMEFKNVYIVNCSEGLLPHENSIENNLEEERRLFYVGITRAIDNLSLCCSSTIRGKTVQVSRFIKECGIFSTYDYAEKLHLKIGDAVVHKLYGEGKIVDKKYNSISILFYNNIEREFKCCALYSSQLIEKKQKAL
ncbi:ATP-dependent DNA helicase pcrA [Clostridiaceae bacterium BL-3]|nr:ATP-dependent DNA helicase pcrA [Clostridiaceae bacterium BL-3]